MAIARNLWGHIERRDHRVMRRLNRWRAPRWIRYWMITATRMGDGWLWYGLGGMLLIFGGASRYEAVAASGSAALIGVLVFKVLKLLSQRPRPCQYEPHCWSKVLPPDRFSFPSGHTMTAFSIALVVSYFYPSLEGGYHGTPEFAVRCDLLRSLCRTATRWNAEYQCRRS